MKVSVIRSLLTLIVPGAGTPPAATAIALLPTFIGLTGALIRTTTCALIGAPVTPLDGLTATTVGAVAGPCPVVKSKIGNDDREIPCRSVMPLLNEIEYIVHGSSAMLGVKVATSPSPDTETVPGTKAGIQFVADGYNWNVAVVTVSGSIRL